MCGIVGAVAQRNVTPILLEGLKRLEYRGYDSAGIALLDADKSLQRCRTVGKVQQLSDALGETPLNGTTGIAHTRWATHGKPTQDNAHPHASQERVAVVHNGIIENHEALRKDLESKGYLFGSETDTETIVHSLHHHLDQHQSLITAVQETVKLLEGAFAIAVVASDAPETIIVARKGSPLVIGLGIEEYFVASDVLALLPVTQQFIFLEDGDVAELTLSGVQVFDHAGEVVERELQDVNISHDAVERGEYRHYMLKEIFEQPTAIEQTLEGRVSTDKVLENAFGSEANAIFDKVEAVQIVACGTSYHAGLVARYWFEEVVGIPCMVDVASEYRYRNVHVPSNCLFVTLSQSGETADTLSALRLAKEKNYLASLVICNVPGSSLVRESDLVLMTHAGPEVGVASTKAFTAQLVSLLLLVLVLARRSNSEHAVLEAALVKELKLLPKTIQNVLALEPIIKELAEKIANREHALFLGRGSQYPVAMEGSLKLKEISYIHAEAYPAGELKHGPLALVDKTMPVIAVAPNNELLEKLKSNLQEVQARGGELFVFSDATASLTNGEGVTVIDVPSCHDITAPIIYTLPLQLLAYHVAVLKGTDVDQPRNLAKSVTVE